MDNLAGDNSQTAVMDNPSTEPISAPNETAQTNGQATETTPTGDLFKGIDPNKLPPEVKGHYQNMLRDYREKTAKLSETIKAEIAKSTEGYKSKAEQYDQILQQEEFVRQWNEYVQKANAAPQTVEGQSDPALAQMRNQLQEITQKLQMTEMSQVTEAFADAVNEKGEKIHPEFDQLNSYNLGKLGEGPEAEDFSLLRACVELSSGANPQEKLANGYKMAKETYTAIFEEGRKAGMGRIQAKVQNGTQPPTNVSGNLSVTDKKPKTAREALEMARKGIVVSR